MSAQADGIGRFPRSLERADAQTIAEAPADAYLDGAESSDDPDRLNPYKRLPSARSPALLGCGR